VCSLKLSDPHNVIPLIGAIGTFQYFPEQDQSIYCDIDRAIMGLPEGPATYEQILETIDVRDKTRFQECTLGLNTKSKVVLLDPFRLNNGNVIQDQVERTFSEDGRIIRIDGKTQLLKTG